MVTVICVQSLAPWFLAEYKPQNYGALCLNLHYYRKLAPTSGPELGERRKREEGQRGDSRERLICRDYFMTCAGVDQRET